MERKVSMGLDKSVCFPSEKLSQFIPSDSTDNAVTLLENLNDNGYLYLKNVIPRDIIMEAKSQILNYMLTWNTPDQKVFEDKTSGLLDSRCGKGCIKSMEGVNSITTEKAVKKVFEHPALFELFKKLFGKPAKSFDYKWLRAMYKDGYTGVHVDSVYMQRGTTATLTCWIPFDDIPVERGGLALVEGSHRLKSFEPLHRTYSLVDLESSGIEGSGWFTEDPREITTRFGSQWKTTDYTAGDIVIFTMRTVHMTLTNQTHVARLSCDTRWYPYDETPDYRYVGCGVLDRQSAPSYGIFGQTIKTDSRTIESFKKDWGFC